MRIVQNAAAMQRLAQRWRNLKTCLVPTMGCLHEGHLSLVQEARRRVTSKGKVIVSIYVNPTQFGPNEDFSKYPRDLARDAQLCRKAGVDLIFAPSDSEMYPPEKEGGCSTYVVEKRLSRFMEGVHRPGHFEGVATVVAKLFNLTLPRWAVFGAKDFQQAAVIHRMTRDLNFPVRIVVAPTVREPDGLAMSSRNRYLSPVQRQQALSLSRALERAHQLVREKKAVAAQRLKREVKEFIESAPEARVQYVELFDPQTLEPVTEARPGIQMALAVFIGHTRLIDNACLGKRNSP